MQTFLPYENFAQSAECLDYRRLGKQRVEAFQIINILDGYAKRNKNGNIAWEHHPAVLMWKGYTDALKLYYNYIVSEWVSRGYKHNMIAFLNKKNIQFPLWLGNEDFHNSHKSNLLRKNKEYYSKFNWNIPDNLEYIWPLKKDYNENKY